MPTLRWNPRNRNRRPTPRGPKLSTVIAVLAISGLCLWAVMFGWSLPL